MQARRMQIKCGYMMEERRRWNWARPRSESVVATMTARLKVLTVWE
jgi:hypothetical protein